MILDVLTREDAEQIRQWRNQELDSLRTPYPLTEDQQREWYDAVVNNRDANARWWAVYDGTLLGYTGIQHIDWQNSNGEISLLIAPEQQGKGYGTQAAILALGEAFGSLNLHMVWGEAYEGAWDFWVRLADMFGGTRVMLRDRVFRRGAYRPAMYFTITRGEYENALLHTGESRKQAISWQE
jgi:RimJ/RimL family protein N-acetyltransferase